jgi:hypothetical protein
MNFAVPILWLGRANGYHGLNDANGDIDVLTWLGTDLPVGLFLDRAVESYF